MLYSLFIYTLSVFSYFTNISSTPYGGAPSSQAEKHTERKFNRFDPKKTFKDHVLLFLLSQIYMLLYDTLHTFLRSHLKASRSKLVRMPEPAQDKRYIGNVDRLHAVPLDMFQLAIMNKKTDQVGRRDPSQVEEEVQKVLGPSLLSVDRMLQFV